MNACPGSKPHLSSADLYLKAHQTHAFQARNQQLNTQMYQLCGG